MTNTQTVHLEPLPKKWPMYRALVGIGIGCGLIIVSCFQLTAPIIKANRIALLERAVKEIFPETKQLRGYEVDSSGHFVATSKDLDSAIVFAVYSSDGALSAFVIRAQGMGYQDVIQLLYGYDPVQQTINRFKVIASRETPGLGTKIETDIDFLRQFNHLPAELNENGNALMHPIIAVKKRQRQLGKIQPAWQIDTITGATISSRAVTRIIAQSSEQWIPHLMKQLKDFHDDTSTP